MNYSESERSMNLETTNNELAAILRKSTSEIGPTTKYLLKPTVLTDGELLKQERIGEKNEDKPHKVILMVGETEAGKSTLINAMINYIMGVRWEHKIWLEVIKISDNQTESQTKAVTVYEVHAHQSPFVLTVIDTPGFGDTEGFDKDERVAEALLQLFRSEEGIHEIHAVCLVMNGTNTRLHERKLKIFDGILSLFGKDIEKNIILLFTHHAQKQLANRLLNFAKDFITKYIRNNENVTFKFDNCQSECFNEEDRESFKKSWDNGIETFKMFFDYLNGINPKSLYMTEGVLRIRKQLVACVNNLKERIELAELRKQALEQTKTALTKFDDGEIQNNFKFEVDEPYKELVPINASWWHWSKQATRCKKCEENCHYPGCWWVSDLSNCSAMTEGKCTVCTSKCVSSEHVKDKKKYVTKTRRVTKTKDDLKKKYEVQCGLMTKLKNEIKQIEAEKNGLVEECYQCLERLMEDALRSTSISSFIHLDFMIEKVKETGKHERVKKLEELKRRATEENRGLVERLSAHLFI